MKGLAEYLPQPQHIYNKIKLLSYFVECNSRGGAILKGCFFKAHNLSRGLIAFGCTPDITSNSHAAMPARIAENTADVISRVLVCDK